MVEFDEVVRAEVSGDIGRFLSAWHTVLAFFHLSKRSVCRMSVGAGMYDYHDERDSDDPPLHFGTMRCRRCGKDFWL